MRCHERPKNARLVARMLARADYDGPVRCHRVVNHAGRLAPGWNEQTLFLQGGGVALKDAAHVELKQFQWDG